LVSSVFIRRAAAAVLAAAVLASFSLGEANTLAKRAEPAVKKFRLPAAKYEPVAFADLPGWAQDDHLAAFKAFLRSCDRVVANARDKPADKVAPPSAALAAACADGLKSASQINSKETARAFFERVFTPNTVINKTRPGVLTGYYEPLLQGSRTKSGPYTTPIYKRPNDLVTVVPETYRGAVRPGTLTHMRKTETGTEPYYTRAQIDQGALKDKGLELLYFQDPIDVFFMQIQGSGRVKLTDGKTIRVQYDGKNGHPYSSIGRYLIEKALLAADKVSMGTLITWLKADPERAKPVLWYNASYVFFRELKGSDDQGAPLGAMNIPLTSGRSLAFDPAYHALGSPVYVSAPSMRHVPNATGFNRLMVGQDVGSAIKGPERGDIYFGSGEEAGKIAGSTKHPAKFYVLVPNAPAAAKAAAQPEKATVKTSSQ
jgi:membrane-bound lytic murein transglycosylase A